MAFCLFTEVYFSEANTSVNGIDSSVIKEVQRKVKTISLPKRSSLKPVLI